MKRFCFYLSILLLGFHANAQTYTNEGFISKEGVFDVSPTGAATYTLPIETPSGPNNIKPTISLTYNSQSGNGLAGWGWNIAGLSSITRVPSTIYHDNKIGKVNFDVHDRYALDGQRLILDKYSYGQRSSEYKTEVFSNLKIVASDNNHQDSSVYGPSGFTVYHPDGRISYYGYSDNHNTNADGVLSWKLYQTVDPQGNFIRYYYTNANNLVYINQIKYGNLSNEGSVSNNIYFHYNTRNRPEVSYVGGKTFKQVAILSRIEVKGQGAQLYRKYKLSHNTTPLGYERLSLIEFAGTDGVYKSPLEFKYNNGTLGNSNIDRKQVINENSSTDNEKKAIDAGDFDADGKMDFLSYNPDEKDELWLHSDNFNNASTQNSMLITQTEFEDVFPSTLMSSDGKVLQEQGITIVTEDIGSNSATVKFKTYKKNSFQYERSVTFPSLYQHGPPERFRYIAGDFNGDGITDVMVMVKYGNEYITNYWYQVYFIDLKRGITDEPLHTGAAFTVQLSAHEYAYDYNGNGKTNLVRIYDGFVKVYAFENNSLNVIAYLEDPKIKLNKPTVFGDFNGDARMDFMTPTATNSSTWKFFISTGERVYATQSDTTQHGIETYEKDIGINYQKKFSQEISGGRKREQKYHYLAQDYNGDGKADILKHEIIIIRDYIYGSSVLSSSDKVELYTNIHPTYSSTPSFQLTATDFRPDGGTDGQLMEDGVPVFLEANLTNGVLEYIYFDKSAQIFPFEFKYDHKEDVLLREVKNKIGAITQFWYKSLNSKSNPYTFAEDADEKYPYININVAPSFKIASNIYRFINDNYKIQTFKYGGAVTHAQGLGFLGFKTLKRTNWEGNGTGEIWNISKHNMQKRGAITEQWTASSSSSNPPSNYISRTQYLYDEEYNNKIYKLSLVYTYTDHKLKGTNFETYYNYDEYKNIERIQKYFFEGSNYIGYDKTYYELYSNNPTSTNNTYHIGRPLKVKNAKSHNGHTFTTYKEYAYNNNLVSLSKAKKNDSGWLTETFMYDAFGNLTQKTIGGADIANRTEKYEYDSSGRFITKSTDILGLETTYTYDGVTGDVLSETSPYGHTSEYKYDEWGRILEETDYLNNTTKHYYNKTDNLFLKIIDYPSGQDKMIYTGQNGLIRKTQKLSLNDKWISKSYKYDGIGRQTKVSEPYFNDESPTQWNKTNYDEYGRVTSQELYTGKTINTSYNGLSTTVNDGTKAITTTTDALGNVVNVSDPGGTIEYEYYANGAMKSANYGDYAIETTIDDWGRKASLEDPSAGNYTYEYNILGELKKETTPKGETIYTYDDQGKVINKSIQGDYTAIDITYQYNNDQLLQKEIGTSNDQSYEYTYYYDFYKRPYSIREEAPTALFKKYMYYDGYGRIKTEKFQSYNNYLGMNSTVTIKNVYDNSGILKEIRDNTNNTLWFVSSENARQQPVQELTGYINQTKTYDEYGFLTNISSSGIIDIDYDFDAERGNLQKRVSRHFNDWTENFTYDSQDRLTKISGDVNHTQNYDARGRMTKNSQIGDYLYSTPNNSNGQFQVYTPPNYKLQRVAPNNQGHLYYMQHNLQEVTYNAFKKPVEVSEEGHGKVSFDYGPLLNRTGAHYGGEQENIENRLYYKQYSSISPVEMITGNTTGGGKIITYIGGDAYTAPVVHIKKNYGENTATGEFYFLHRDYLGSILAITDNGGNVVEQRHYSAWGEVDKFVDNQNNTTFSHSSLINRGYTGHEHFFEVGLIHMNGRMYDPHLGRFLSPDNYVQDPYNTQSFNRYSYVVNNPLIYVDQNGEFWHIVIGAAVGGVINLGIKAYQGKINSWGDGFVAFGIGATAGAIGAATGGAAFAAAGGAAGGTGGFLAGAAGGAVGTAFASPVQNIGNSIYFGDPLMTPKQYITGIAIGAVTGGAINGGIAAANGRSFWSGNLPRPQAVPVSTIQMQGIKDNNLSLQNAKNQIKSAIPDNGNPINYKAEYYNKVMGPDGVHNWNRTTIEIIADKGKVFPGFNPKDPSQILIQHYGNRFGTEGVFEIIIKNGVIQHQGFNPGGIINGVYQGVGPISPPTNWWGSNNYWPFK